MWDYSNTTATHRTSSASNNGESNNANEEEHHHPNDDEEVVIHRSSPWLRKPLWALDHWEGGGNGGGGHVDGEDSINSNGTPVNNGRQRRNGKRKNGKSSSSSSEHDYSLIEESHRHDAAAAADARDNHINEDEGGIEMQQTRTKKDDAVDSPLSIVGQQNEQDDEGHHPPHITTTTSHENERLPRHLSLLDLISIGVGGTVGSGIFVLCGLVANEHAGPATCLSWSIAGCAAFLSGCCYAELSGRIPTAGSSYAYAYASMGELPAFVTASCLVLEFLVSGSAVARSWGDKVVEWLTVELNVNEQFVSKYLTPGYGINPMACIVSASATCLLLAGVKESKIVTDIFTWLKVSLVMFMAIGGLILLDTTNLQPFIPPEFGMTGVMRGATTSFFGYLGYDGICCVAGEAKNPTMNLPKAVMLTLVIVTSLYVVAALALTGMQSYKEISVESGFPEAFASRGVMWAAQLTAAGEVFTLPIVVLISGVLQPRLQYALARDGLLPHMFCEANSEGNLRKGTMVAGSLMTLIATFIPFEYLDDFVSAGILVAFSITNSSLVIMRRDSPEDRPFLLEKLLLLFNGLSFLSAFVLVHGTETDVGIFFAVCFAVATASVGCWISYSCPRVTVFGGRRMGTNCVDNREYFQTPFVPLIPCLGTFTNWYLIAQLDILGIALLLCYFALSIAFYFSYGAKNSVGNNIGWNHADFVITEEEQEGQAPKTSPPCVQNGHTIT